MRRAGDSGRLWAGRTTTGCFSGGLSRSSSSSPSRGATCARGARSSLETRWGGGSVLAAGRLSAGRALSSDLRHSVRGQGGHLFGIGGTGEAGRSRRGRASPGPLLHLWRREIPDRERAGVLSQGPGARLLAKRDRG